MATRLEELQAKAEAMRQRATEAHPEYWQAQAETARAEAAEVEARQQQDTAELKALYAEQYAAAEQCQEAKLKAAAAFVKATEAEHEAREQLRATVRRLHAAGNILPHLGAIHTRPDYDTRRAVDQFVRASRGSF